MNDSIKVIKYSKENSYLKEDEYNLNNNAAHLKEYDSDLNDCECKNECENHCECENDKDHDREDHKPYTCRYDPIRHRFVFHSSVK